MVRAGFALGLEQHCRTQLANTLSTAVMSCTRSVRTQASDHYVSLFDVQQNQILVGLDRNPKAVAVMSVGTYRAGMEDTYFHDKEHYDAITDQQEKLKALSDCDRRVRRALPAWFPPRPTLFGYEYLNLKEK